MRLFLEPMREVRSAKNLPLDGEGLVGVVVEEE
jgi:hypothetical protein